MFVLLFIHSLMFFVEWSTSLDSLIIVSVDCFFVGSALEAMAVDEVYGFLYWGQGNTLKRATLMGDNTKDIIKMSKLHRIRTLCVVH